MRKQLSIIALVGILALLIAPVPVAFAADNDVVVRPSTLNGWLFVDEGAPGSTADLVVGPATPPLGSGSSEFVLGAAAEGMSFQYYDPSIVALPLSDVTSLEYCTYVASAPGPQAVSLQINFDDDVTDGDIGWKGRLVYEPYFNGTVVLNSWQCWDTLSGKWWATGAPANGFAPQSNPQSLTDILAAFPNSGFNSSFGGMLLKAGSGWASFDGNADAVVLGVNGVETAFNFEAGPATKDDCKNGGWANYGFPNQGQCIAYYNQHVK